ncbi:MAG: hypothetical protein QOK43_2542 [Acidimicrobiaceae bacterium]|nr:hypothetical protein [Acidimicrobiaceae bacterium]
MADLNGRGVVSVHVADIGVPAVAAALVRPPRPGSVKGLRQANVGVGAPLSPKTLPTPTFGRLVLLSFWDDDDAIDRFNADHPLAQRLAHGWHVRLEPLRSFGSWPGLSDDLPHERSVEHDGPAVVLTLGQLRLTQARRFLRASAKASGSAIVAPGFVWGTAWARPPFVSTCSIWESTKALSTYAYGRQAPAHADAIDADLAKPFHHRSAFVRFRPYRSEGALPGKNPLPAGALA